MSMNDRRGMSEDTGRPLVEQAAIAIQNLCREEGRGGWNRLVRIDNRIETEKAPFRFDAESGLVHRAGCPALTMDARSASYGLWQITGEATAGKNVARRCKRCRPMPEMTEDQGTGARETKIGENKRGPDLLFGLVSILDQFGNVLKERGKDYRETDEGRKIGAELQHFYQALGRREKAVLDTLLASLEMLTGRVREAEQQVKGECGTRRD